MPIEIRLALYGSGDDHTWTWSILGSRLEVLAHGSEKDLSLALAATHVEFCRIKSPPATTPRELLLKWLSERRASRAPKYNGPEFDMMEAAIAIADAATTKAMADALPKAFLVRCGVDSDCPTPDYYEVPKM